MSRRRSAILLALLVTVIVARCALVWFSDAVLTTDSSRYRNPSDPLSTFNPYGHGPGVLTQAWFLLPLQLALVVQTLVASTIYAAGVWIAVRGAAPRLQFVVAAALIAWTLSPWFLLWDAWVLTEAAALCGCFLAAVGAGRFAVGASGPSAMLLGLTIGVTARPVTLIALGPIVLLALLFTRRQPRWRATVAAFVVLSAFAAAQAIAFEKGTEFAGGRNVDGLRAASRLMERSDQPGYLRAARDHGMPACSDIDTALETSDPEFRVIWEAENCPDFRAWLDAGGLPWTAELAANPAAMLAGFVDPGEWVREPMSPYWLLDGRFYTAFEILGSRWTTLLKAVNALMFTAMAGAVAIAAWPRGRGQFFSLMTVAACVSVSFVAWASDGMEYWRHLLPSFAVLFPAVVAARTSRPLPLGTTDDGDRPADAESITA